jgi:hypothetical protein
LNIVNSIVNAINATPGNYTSSTNISEVFFYNILNESNLTECDLILNGINETSNQSAITNGTNNFTLSLGVGSYEWYVSCRDVNENTTNTTIYYFTISSPPVQKRGGSTSSGSGTILIATAQNITLTDQEISTGITKSAGNKDKINFALNLNWTKVNHTLIINQVTNNTVNLTVYSDPINLILGIGQSVKLNLTSEKYYDLLIKIESIQNGKANITIKSINESIFPQVNNESSNESSDKKNESIFGQGVKNIITHPLLTIATSLGIIILLVALIFSLIAKKGLKKIYKLKARTKK